MPVPIASGIVALQSCHHSAHTTTRTLTFLNADYSIVHGGSHRPVGRVQEWKRVILRPRFAREVDERSAGKLCCHLANFTGLAVHKKHRGKPRDTKPKAERSVLRC